MNATKNIIIALQELRGELGRAPEVSQSAKHGAAWAAVYCTSIIQLIEWQENYNGQDKELADELSTLIIGEYLNQLLGGIAMSQNEITRPSDWAQDWGINAAAILNTPAINELREGGNTAARRARIAALLLKRGNVDIDYGYDETHRLVCDQFRRFADAKLAPAAHRWHLNDELIPLPIIKELAAMGTFALCLPEEYGGAGLGKQAMCIVSETLSSGFLGAGSLGTRTDIAGELILANGTPEQKQTLLPQIADGSIIPTAVFTEPDIGSDLAHLTCRAQKVEGGYKIYGAKTWITHAARADMMTLLVRTDPSKSDHNGLSMLLAAKKRGSDTDPFPDAGLSGSEISVLGYRGMREYALSFDGFFVSDSALLGGKEGAGFKQLMQTFESARIQTAARALGVAQAAAASAFTYAQERMQFAKPIYSFARVQDKIIMSLAEIIAARALTHHAAKLKEAGARCDLEAGMAKLLAARVAWAAADNGVQIHGGNGFALEYEISRILCDARVLNIFEGAAEIQADVIHRRLVETAQN